MKPVVTPLHPLFVAKITEVDLGRPIDETTQTAIEHAMDTYAVCVLPGQHLEDEELIAFSRLYGPLEVSTDIGRKSRAGRNRRIVYREIFDISNLDENGGIRGEQDARSSLQQVTQLWHTDLAFRQAPAQMAGRRPRDLGQPLHRAPRHAFRGNGPCARHAPHDDHRPSPGRACRVGTKQASQTVLPGSHKRTSFGGTS